MTRDDEDRAVRALLVLAERCGTDQRAARLPGEYRGDDEAARIAYDHGFDEARLVPLRSLAQSRGAPLETVLRAALRGDLRETVQLEAAATTTAHAPAAGPNGPARSAEP